MIASTARITQQFRELENTTYELDCSGVPLAIRIISPVGNSTTSTWRVEISGADVVVAACWFRKL